MSQSLTPSRRRPGRLLAALAISAGLIGAACGGDDGGTSTETTAGAGTETTAAGGTETTAAATTVPPPTTEAGIEPVAGGKVIMGIEADTSNPWRPAEMLCAIACHQVIRNIYDSLTMPNDEGSWSPYLAESVTPNDDFTVWTITARDDVTFHDGTPFDGAAIADNLTRGQAGITTGAILRSVTDVSVDPADPMSAVVTVSASWAAFPFALIGQVGYMASPAWLAASDAETTLKTAPVGTGPFVYADYKPNELFRMTKNPDYWNAPYPYLDELEFRPISDGLNRRDALSSGTIDMLHTGNGQNIAEYRVSDEVNYTEITNNGETGYTLLHVTQEGSPLQDRRVRCALAYATDNPALNETIGASVNELANGPFSPTQIGYLEDSGFPMEQDMAMAQQLIAEYKAEFPGPISLALATTQDQTNLTIAQFQQQWWIEAGIDEVTIDQIDQASYILTAAFGDFQVFQWRNHGGFDLDQQYFWWHSTAAADVGALALNFGRIKDPALDALLDENRASDDPARKQEIAEEVNRLFATECYNLWGSYSTWGIASKTNVQPPTGFELPDGKNVVFGAGISGVFYAMTVWVEP